MQKLLEIKRSILAYKRYKSYFNYIIKHKYYVMIKCFKYGLYWRGIMHDISKFLPDEFIPYARYFFNENGTIRIINDNDTPLNTINYDFELAWSKHCKRNKHHWQYWTLPSEYDKTKMFNIPEKYLVEMICDWYGAAKTQGIENPDMIKWYKNNRRKMNISGKTAKKLGKLVKVIK